MYKQPGSLEITIAIVGAIMLLNGGAVTADVLTVPNTFVPNTAATADSVNQNFNAVETEVTDNANDISTNAAGISTNASGISTNASDISTNAADISTNATDIANIASQLSNSVDFSDYFPTFSTLGSPRNALVLEAPNGSGGTIYRVRGGYETNSEQININGVATNRTHFYRSVSAETDSNGDLISLSRYRESPDDINDYFNSNSYTAKVDNTTFDPVSLAETIDPNDYTETFTCGDDGVGAVLVCHAIDRLNSDNSPFGHYQWSRIQSVYSGTYEINGLTFTNVRFESYNDDNNRFRIRAKGIGMIFEDRTNSAGPQQIIYYQVNGQTGGSLVDTPFEPGVGVLDGLFF